MTGILKIKWCLALLLPVAVMFSFSLIYARSQGKSPLIEREQYPSRELVDLFQTGDQFFGFKKVEGPTYYIPDKLFDYINGGAELFLAYGFSELLVVELAEDQNHMNRATLEIYNMGTLENAFGVFKTEEGDETYRLPGGAEGRMGNGLLQFYKGKFYVKVFLPPQSKAYRKVVEKIGKTVEERIEGTFSKPAFFDLFPVKDRIADSENYTSKDFLGQPFFKGIASAQFMQEGKTYRVFLSVEPNREEAEESFQKYREYLISERAYQGKLKGGTKGFVGNDPYYGNCVISVIKGRIVGILGNSGDAVALIKSIERGI
ncbi:MAG: hypothetical protein KAJ00_04605 [Deltaproteobacteria bacterium]|nr:hypothetical protein [Deltaproteobacteria bacterium]NOQ86204.1 hypothetical protein [Deltaproteobacteria bacterium]